MSADRHGALEGRYPEAASGSWRGATLSGDGVLELAEDSVAIASLDGARRLPLP